MNNNAKDIIINMDDDTEGSNLNEVKNHINYLL